MNLEAEKNKETDEHTIKRLRHNVEELRGMLNTAYALCDSDRGDIARLVEKNLKLTGKIKEFELLRFPSNLRKSWTGNEIQAWINDQIQYITGYRYEITANRESQNEGH